MNSELVARAVALHAAGFTQSAIGRELGVPRTTVQRWVDPRRAERERAWKSARRPPCLACGGPTTSLGSRAPFQGGLCRACWMRHDGGRIWTREIVIAAIREWMRIYGASPVAADWNPSLAIRLGHPEKAERFRADDRWPAAKTVSSLFGSWNTALRAASVPYRTQGHHVGEEEQVGAP